MIPSYLEKASAAYKLEKARNKSAGWTIWQPDPRNKPQCLAYELAKTGAVMEIGYGGQAGGGKTDLALGLASTVFSKSLILRREFPQLEGIIDRGDEIFPTAFVHGSKKRWQFNSRIITLGSMQHDKDWSKYQGRAGDFLAIDECAEFNEKPVRSITGWRRAKPGQKTLVLYLFNPPTTPEGEWIVRYFAPWIDPDYPGERAKAGEIRWFIHVDRGYNKPDEIVEVADGSAVEYEGKSYLPISRTFIAASRYDNPFLDAEYERRLDALPEPLRTMVKEGDFTLGKSDDDWQVFPTNLVLAAQGRWNEGKPINAKLRAIGVDPAHGGIDETVISKLYGTWFDENIKRPGSETPEGKDVANLVLKNMETPCPIGIDAVGYGSTAAERLTDHANLTVYKINAGESSNKLDKNDVVGFANLRAEMHWKFREALEEGEIALPPGRDIRVQFCSPRYSLRSGKYVVEDKDDIKKRIKRSPDDMEAILHCWHAAGMRPAVAQQAAYNPFIGGRPASHNPTATFFGRAK